MSKHSPAVRAAAEAAAAAAALANPKPAKTEVQKVAAPIVPDFADCSNTFLARIIGCLRSGMNVEESLQLSASLGWMHTVGDTGRTGACWRWPGPQPFVMTSEFVASVIATATSQGIVTDSICTELESQTNKSYPAVMTASK
jgi:hypothetical protein